MFLLKESGGCLENAAGVVIETDMKVAQRRLSDGTWTCREWTDMKYMQVEKISLTWHHIRCRHGGLEGMFLCFMLYLLV